MIRAKQFLSSFSVHLPNSVVLPVGNRGHSPTSQILWYEHFSATKNKCLFHWGQFLQEEHHVRLFWDTVEHKSSLALLQTIFGWATIPILNWESHCSRVDYFHYDCFRAKVAQVLQTVLGWANTIPGRTAGNQRRLQAMEAPGRFKNPAGGYGMPKQT